MDKTFRGAALLLLLLSAVAYSQETSRDRAEAAAEISELQQAIDASRTEADAIRERNRKLEARRQALEKRINALREELLRQSQATQSIGDSDSPETKKTEAVSDQATTARPAAE